LKNASGFVADYAWTWGESFRFRLNGQRH